MKKINKDIVSVVLLIVSFLAFVYILANTKYYYGSTVDWYQQHIAFPEYFRLLFYKTKNLFPDFAFNIGAGQNIYNFSYYGLLSPMVIVSYLFPFVNMTIYMIIATIVSVILSAILLYFWLRKKGFKESVAFLSAFMFLFAVPISFHSHRHIMFINYMPFLIMGLYGVDKKLTKNKSSLLIISTFLMIMTSYYYSIGGIIALVIYGVYKYLKINKKITVKNFFKDGILFVCPILIGVLCASIIILPTFQVILSSRGETFTSITLKELLVPEVHLGFFMYDAYGIGLTSVVILAIVNLFTKSKENKFLGIILSLALLFPIFNYILNATMYIDAKALIPMLPLCIIAITILVDDIFNKKFNYKVVIPMFILVTLLAYSGGRRYKLYLIDVFLVLFNLLIYKKFNKEYLFIIPFLIGVFTIDLFVSFNDEYVTVKDHKALNLNLKDAINYITDKDDSIYRISNTTGSDSNNRIFNNLDYYNTTIYSSTYNMDYNKFFYDVMNNNIQSRNRVITSNTNNILFNMFMSNKYIVNKTSSKKDLQGYELVDTVGDLSIYKNDNVLPLGYATSNLMSYNEFDRLKYPNTALALLNNIIVEEDSNTDYISDLKTLEFNENNLVLKDVLVQKDGGHYIIYSTGKGKMTYTLDEEDRNKIIFVEFTMNESPSCDLDDISITINGNKNKLTCAEWKYHNQNYVFDYVIADDDLSTLNIKFTKGTFNIKDIKLYAIDYAYIENVASKVYPLEITKITDKGVEGTIDVKKDGYFTLSVPYQEGFTAYVDGKEVPVEKVNVSFIGFSIKSGKHDIKIVYNSPLKKISLCMSGLGFVILGIITFLESKQKI